MNKIVQEARKRQGVVKLAVRKGKSFAARIYGVSLSSVKRWTARYDGTWQSLREKSPRPHSHPARHISQEEAIISAGMDEAFFRYGWEGAYMAAKKRGYTRSYGGFIYAAKRMEDARIRRRHVSIIVATGVTTRSCVSWGTRVPSSFCVKSWPRPKGLGVAFKIAASYDASILKASLCPLGISFSSCLLISI